MPPSLAGVHDTVAMITAAFPTEFRGALGQTPHFSSAYSGKSTGLGVRMTGVEFSYQLITS